MLREKRLDSSLCASCQGKISLVQINGKTFPVEPLAGFIGGSLIILELHRCSPRDGKPEQPSKSPKRKQVV